MDKTLLHDTYGPMIIKWLDCIFVVKNIPLVCKWLNNIIFKSGQRSISLCKQLTKNDFGCFIERCPKIKTLLTNKQPRELLKNMYLDLESILKNEKIEHSLMIKLFQFGDQNTMNGLIYWCQKIYYGPIDWFTLFYKVGYPIQKTSWDVFYKRHTIKTKDIGFIKQNYINKSSFLFKIVHCLPCNSLCHVTEYIIRRFYKSKDLGNLSIFLEMLFADHIMKNWDETKWDTEDILMFSDLVNMSWTICGTNRNEKRGRHTL
ncbi:MAG: hypothetical protein GY714_14205 [Desulfobacterales bacterium]|nr:hypothetical protein [Desulfobacterales bacterium]